MAVVVGLEAGLVLGPGVEAGMEEEVAGPDLHRRPHQNCDSGCVEAAEVAEAVGRKEGEDRGRSLLARPLMDCPAGVEEAQHRAGPEPGKGCGLNGRRVVEGARMEEKHGDGEGDRQKWRGECQIHSKRENPGFEKQVVRVKRLR